MLIYSSVDEATQTGHLFCFDLYLFCLEEYFKLFDVINSISNRGHKSHEMTRFKALAVYNVLSLFKGLFYILFESVDP